MQLINSKGKINRFSEQKGKNKLNTINTKEKEKSKH